MNCVKEYCEKCFHKSVCEKKTCAECQSSYCDECGVYSTYDGAVTEEHIKNCKNFVDKSLIRALPCNAGETMYVPQGGSKFKTYVIENFIVTPDTMLIKTVDGCYYDADDVKSDGILVIKPVMQTPPISFYISTENSSGMEFQTKEAFMSEVSKMVDDCIENGGSRFDIQVDSDVSCFYDSEILLHNLCKVREIAEKIVDFYEDFDFYSFSDTLEVGETKEDAVEKIIADLANPQTINDAIDDIENIIGEAESEEDKEKARQLLKELKALRGETI